MSDEKKNDDKINPEDIRKTEIFLKIPAGGDEKTELALAGFFLIWTFEKNLADFRSPKINIELVKKLKNREISIEDFVRDSLKNEITSKLFLNEGDDFAKYYFKWKYFSDAKKILGEKFSATWENYAKIKVKIEERFQFWKKDPVAAQTAKLKEKDADARAGQLRTRKKNIFVIPPHPNTTFDEKLFLEYLEGSISLTMEEKKRVIEAIPRLKIEQINELFKIFKDERKKFAELENEFSDDVQKLKREREREIENNEAKQEEVAESDEDANAAEELKKKLMGE